MMSTLTCGLIGFGFIVLSISIFSIIVRANKEHLKELKGIIDVIFIPSFFTLLMIMLVLVDILFVLLFSDCCITPLLCSIYLVVSWLLADRICKLLDNGENRILNKSDKHFCHIVAHIWIIIYSLILSYHGEKAFSLVAASSASIIIGSYISIDSIFDKGLKGVGDDLSKIIADLKCRTVIICLICGALMLIVFNTKVIYDVVNNKGFSIGVLMGAFLATIVLDLINKKHRGESIPVQ